MKAMRKCNEIYQLFLKLPKHRMKNLEYHNVGTVSNSNRKIIERGKTDASNTQLHKSLTFTKNHNLERHTLYYSSIYVH
jgi:hypothetical protein